MVKEEDKNKKPAKLIAQVDIGSPASPQKRHSKISARITYGNLMILGGPSTSNQRPEKPEDAPVAPSINEPTLFRDGGVFQFLLCNIYPVSMYHNLYLNYVVF